MENQGHSVQLWSHMEKKTKLHSTLQSESIQIVNFISLLETTAKLPLNVTYIMKS